MLPNQKTSRHILRICAILLLFSMLVFTAVWTRVQNRDSIPNGQFTETDAYFYYWQAQLISEHGRLPERDMHRWLPIGRDNRQTLNLYPYVVAYTHKAVSTVFTGITLYHVAFYMPVVCFCIGLSALCFFLYHTHGLLFSFSVGMLLALLPGSIARSATGFGDRDTWCLMLGILSIITYLTVLQAQHRNIRFFWTLISGFTVFLGGLSWEGFGAFLAVILVVELWRFLTSQGEDELTFYALWVLTFVPTLYLASPVYRSGYGFAKHLAALMLAPPLIFFWLSQNTLKVMLRIALLILLLCFPVLGGFALQTHTNAEKLNMALLKDSPLANAYQWMKTTLPKTAVVAARWRYGSQLNVLAGVKTIIDQDHYIQHWIHLYRRYISLGIDPHEMLGFLKTHQATHLMIPQKSAPHAIEQAEASGALVPVYPTPNFDASTIKIWEIHYPPDIKTDMKYLKTGVPEIDADLQIQ